MAGRYRPADMRQPTLRRSHQRQQRLVRTGIGITVLVGVAALLANLLSGDGGETPPAETPSVAFVATTTTYADSGTVQAEDEVPASRVQTHEEQITELLDTWYQRTFVDPDVFEVSTTSSEAGAPSFPPAEALDLFGESARVLAAADVDALTLGSQRTDFSRVEPTVATADVSILFRSARNPKLATVSVTFQATGTLKDATAPQVAIAQTADFTLEHDGEAWRIVYYEADQEQDSIMPTTTPTASP